MKKKLLAGAIGIMVLGAVPAFAATSEDDAPSIQQTSNTQPPQMQNGQRPPEPPKDADGNPLPPPDFQANHNGIQPPDPPKDADGNPLPPPNHPQEQNVNPSAMDNSDQQLPSCQKAQNDKLF